MNMNMNTTLAIMAMVAGLSTSAMATPFVLTAGPGFTNGDLTGNINFTGSPNIHENAYIGPLNMTITDTVDDSAFNQTLYCTDIFDNFVSGGTYNTSFSSLLARLGATKVNQLNALLFHAVVTDQASGAAVQAAIWEIENETGTTAYNIASGAFTITGVSDPTFYTDVGNDLTNINNGTWQPLSTKAVEEYVLVDGQSPNQSFSFLTAKPKGDTHVPEPLSIGIFGLGLVGLIGARRKSK